MAFDPLTSELLDFFGGRADIASGILRHTSAAFADDPLRVLRGMQFAARFGMTLAPETVAVCRDLRHEYGTLAVERVWQEWEKLLAGRFIAHGMDVLAATGWVACFPELAALAGCEQDAEHHPEGDAFAHTVLVADAAAHIAARDGLVGDDRIVLVLSAVCHDFGKALTTIRLPNGRITSHGHASAGEVPTRMFLARIGCPVRFHDRIACLVREHMVHVSISDVAPRVARRLAVRLAAHGASIAELARLCEADHSGRPPLPGGLPPVMARLCAVAAQAVVDHAAPTPLVQGRDLIALGLLPGPAFGQILRAVFEAQVDGVCENREAALEWVRQRYTEAPTEHR